MVLIGGISKPPARQRVWSLNIDGYAALSGSGGERVVEGCQACLVVDGDVELRPAFSRTWVARSPAGESMKPVSLKVETRPHTTCSPSGTFCGSRQKASLTKRLNRSGGSKLARGSALTVRPTVCSPGVPARSSNSVTS
jgi:hypothetical protein